MDCPQMVDRFTLHEPDWDVLDAELPFDMDELELKLQGETSCLTPTVNIL
jgi:hypothetical protein